MSSIFTSSVGKKLMMSLAGLFLIVFLLVHLGINLLLILYDSPETYNRAAHFMQTNLLIKIIEVVLFGGFFLHMIYGLIVQIENWLSRPKGYRIANYSQTSFFSRFMIHTAAIIFVFLVIHLMDFYFRAKFGEPELVRYSDGKEMVDFGSMIVAKFHMPEFVIGYILAFLFLGFHLLHGFQSAFQTLGLNHKTYTPVIKVLGILYTLLVVSGFTAIPLVIYFD
ncbi:MAG: succinate dehydrogenase cytochrome b subunit [Bacteroidales bacterium]|jgi:succinate dehydrogenase / fumarate reductase cytochrome b subunit|nr:succinate dehydrogenase cytochrome b subunit [Bacteroidales bacterium]